MNRFLRDVIKTPVVGEIVELAAKHSGLKVFYRGCAQKFDEMNAEQQGEVWREGCNEHNGAYGSIWTEELPEKDLSPFWEEYNRLKELIKTPLNENILEDDFPLHPGYFYIKDGKVFEHIDPLMSVGTYKRAFDVKEVRRYDFAGRRKRLPPRKEPETELRQAINSAGNNKGQKRRKPRNSNKIKKVR